VRVHRSALKHGVSPGDLIFAATNWEFASDLLDAAAAAAASRTCET
jgi:hypothetical protein